MLELVRNPGRTTAANRATREEQQLRAEKPARHREAEVPRRVVRPAAVEITVELERIRGSVWRGRKQYRTLYRQGTG